MVHNKSSIRHAFNAAAAHYDTAADIQRHANMVLAARLARERTPAVVLDAGCGTGAALAHLHGAYPTASLIAVDLAPAMLAETQRRGIDIRTLAGDLEQLPFPPACLDLYWSNLAAQWCDLPKLLAEAARTLRPGGRLLLATLGPRTFHELRSALAASDAHRHTLDFETAERLSALTGQAGFRDVRVDTGPIVTHHADLATLMRSIKTIGANRVGPGGRSGLMSRAAFLRAVDAYEKWRAPAGLPLTYDLIFLEATR